MKCNIKLQYNKMLSKKIKIKIPYSKIQIILNIKQLIRLKDHMINKYK